jgi:hypothetical protein
MKSTNQLHLTLLGLGVFASIASSQNPGTFIAIGNMIKARADHTATLLYNDKVLLAGGLSFALPAFVTPFQEKPDYVTNTRVWKVERETRDG